MKILHVEIFSIFYLKYPLMLYPFVRKNKMESIFTFSKNLNFREQAIVFAPQNP